MQRLRRPGAGATAGRDCGAFAGTSRGDDSPRPPPRRTPLLRSCPVRLDRSPRIGQAENLFSATQGGFHVTPYHVAKPARTGRRSAAAARAQRAVGMRPTDSGGQDEGVGNAQHRLRRNVARGWRTSPGSPTIQPRRASKGRRRPRRRPSAAGDQSGYGRHAQAEANKEKGPPVATRAPRGNEHEQVRRQIRFHVGGADSGQAASTASPRNPNREDPARRVPTRDALADDRRAQGSTTHRGRGPTAIPQQRRPSPARHIGASRRLRIDRCQPGRQHNADERLGGRRGGGRATLESGTVRARAAAEGPGEARGLPAMI